MGSYRPIRNNPQELRQKYHPYNKDGFFSSFPKPNSYSFQRGYNNSELPKNMKEEIKRIPVIPYSYYTLNSKNNIQDREGCLSAGLLLSKLDENKENLVLMVYEPREGKQVLNFPGGKRGLNDTSPEYTAIREFDEETDFLYNQDQIYDVENMLKYPCSAFWYHRGRYCLFTLPMSENMKKLDLKSKKLHWINVKHLMNVLEQETVISSTTNEHLHVSHFVKKLMSEPMFKEFIQKII